MALLFMDGFDHMDESGGYDVPHKWDYWNVSFYIVTGGRYGGNAIRTPAQPADLIYKSLGSAVTTIYTNLFFYTTDGAQYAYPIHYGYDGTAQIQIGILATGSIIIKRGDHNGTIIASSATGVITWTGCYIEVKIVFHDTTGTVDVKVDGTSVISETALDTQNVSGGCNQVGIRGGEYNVPRWACVDDFVVFDSSGSYNNTWLGDVCIDTLYPSGAGSNTDFTPSAGNNYECVDEDHPNTSDNVYASTQGDIDTYAFDDLSGTSSSILAVQAHMFAKKDTSGTRKIRAVTRQSATEYNGDDIALADTYSYKNQLWEINPADSAAWEDADVNGAEFGFEVRGVT